MRLVLLGPPGSGKGTQGARLSAELKMPAISTGDILRTAVAEGTELGRKARGYMDAGALVPDEVMLGLVEERLRRRDCAPGFILDGFPRTLAQAEGLDGIIERLAWRLDRVLLFEVPRALVVSRLAARSVCTGCGRVFSAVTAPADAVCPACGGRIARRDDDAVATVERRLDVYAKESGPVVSFYENRTLLARVEGAGTIEDVHRRILSVLGVEGART